MTLFLSLLTHLLLHQLLPMAKAIREVDERLSKFLFAADPNAKNVVLEYQLHLAPEEDFEQEALEDHAYDHKIGDVSDYESTKHIRPYFLSNKIFNPRVVLFYSPWSGGSIDFKPSFIELAKEIKRRQKKAPLGVLNPATGGGPDEDERAWLVEAQKFMRQQQHLQGARAKRDAFEEIVRGDRYMRRAANQLVKALKASLKVL